MYIYGKNTIRELLISNKHAHHIFITKDFNDDEILNLIKKRRIEVEIKESKYIDGLVDSYAQGIVAKIENYEYKNIDYLIHKTADKEYPLIVLLDQITDIHNLASIIRVCECVGVDGIIIPKTRSAEINASVYKISSGAIFNVDICQVSNLNNTIKKLKDNNYWIVGSDLNTDNDYTSVDYKMKTGLIIGSEGKGIIDTTRKQCDFLVKIPMVGKINSLNASVAAGILCYQIFNDRKG